MRLPPCLIIILIAFFEPWIAVSGAVPPFAGEPRMVADLNIDEHLVAGAPIFVVAGFVELGGELFFSNDDGIHGPELWKVDEQGHAVLVRDVCPGVCGYNFLGGLDGAAIADRLVFAADDGERGSELWVSDGTAAGTELLAEISPGKIGSDPRSFLAAGGFVYFSAGDGVHGRELWRTDGTAEGTAMIADAVSGPEGLDPQPFAESQGLVWILGRGLQGVLWRSDGTAGGTLPVTDVDGRTFEFQAVSAGLRCWARSWAVLADGDLLFSDRDAEVRGLWRSDGTPGGTFEVRPLVRVDQFAALDDTVLFLGTADVLEPNRLWRTDGTPEGTEVVLPLDYPWALTAAGSHAFFNHEDPEHGLELWRSDGTVDGTEMVADIIEGPEGGMGSSPLDVLWHLPQPYSELGGSFLFAATTPESGFELWSTPVSAGGATQVADLNPGVPSSPPSRWLSTFVNHCPGRLSDRLYFFAHDDAAGLGLWRTAGTAATTEKVVDVTVQTSSSTHFDGRSWIASLVVGDRLFFTTADYHSGGYPEAFDLWITDGSAAGTRLVVAGAGPLPRTSRPIVEAGGKVYFAGLGGALWVTDGTPDGTVPGMVFEEQDGPVDLTPFGSDVLFFGTSGGTSSLWRSDGTPANTVALAKVVPCLHTGFLSDVPDTGFTATTGDLAFFCGDEVLWRTDGTPEGTWTLPSGARPRGLTAAVADREGASPLVLFTAEDEDNGRELWRSDGTVEGTRLVVDLRPGAAGALAEDVRPVFGDRLYFAADDGTFGTELWASDGTAEGTVRVADLAPGSAGSDPKRFTLSGDLLYFVADTEDLGCELWSSDGTSSGTLVVADLVPGEGSSLPSDLAALPGGGLAFAAYAPDLGRELFAVEPGGLPSSADVAPGAASSSPSALRWSPSRLFFFANDNRHGFEMWSWTTAAFVFGDGFESGDLCAWTRLDL